jgi:hypothetical protein
MARKSIGLVIIIIIFILLLLLLFFIFFFFLLIQFSLRITTLFLFLENRLKG